MTNLDEHHTDFLQFKILLLQLVMYAETQFCDKVNLGWLLCYLFKFWNAIRYPNILVL
jgi:hypothetical protein